MNVNLLDHCCGCRQMWKSWTPFWGCSNQRSLAMTVAISIPECSHLYELVKTNVVLLTIYMDLLKWIPISLSALLPATYTEMSVLCKFPVSWNFGGPQGCFAGACLSDSVPACCGCQPSGASECAGSHVPGGLCSNVITRVMAASATSVLLSWRFTASVELSTTPAGPESPVKVCHVCSHKTEKQLLLPKLHSCGSLNVSVQTGLFQVTRRLSLGLSHSMAAWELTCYKGEGTRRSHYTHGSSAFLSSSYHKGDEFPEKLKVLPPPTLRSGCLVWSSISIILKSLSVD